MASTEKSFVKPWIKIAIVFGIIVILYEFEVISNYKLFDIMQMSTFYSKSAYGNMNKQCNVTNIWNLPSEISNTTNYETLIIRNNTISPLFTRIEKSSYAIFCSNGYKPGGTGNALAIYFTARAIAFFMNWTFVMNNNVNNITKTIDTSCSNQAEYGIFKRRGYPRMKWTWFLQMEYNTTINNMCTLCNQTTQHKIALKYNYIWQYYTAKSKKGIWSVPYWGYLMFLIYNPWFAQIAQHDTANAFKRYYSYQPNGSISISKFPYWIDKQHTNMDFYNHRMNEIGHPHQHVIVIHIRCGDLLYHGYRYLLNMQYFIEAIDKIFHFIQLYKNDTSSEHKVYKFRVISQLTKFNSHSNKDVDALNMSNKMVYFMCEQIQKYIKSNYKNIKYSFDIIGNGTTDNDYFEMATTKYVICSPSSFCFNAVIANYVDPQLIILPQIGAWAAQINTYIEIAKNTHCGVLSHHKWINTDSMFTTIAKLFSNQPTEQELAKFKRWFVG